MAIAGTAGLLLESGIIPGVKMAAEPKKRRFRILTDIFILVAGLVFIIWFGLLRK